MAPIKVMVNDINGNLGEQIARAVMESKDMELVPLTFTGPERTAEKMILHGYDFKYQNILPDMRNDYLQEILDNVDVVVDATIPSGVNVNADFYCSNNLPFVMGTTGGDRNLLEERVRNSKVPAIISQNMAKQIVEFQEMVKEFSYEFEGKWIKDPKSGLYIREIHQGIFLPDDFYGKADTSGTAKDVVKSFNRIGLDYDEKDIAKIRDREDQLKLGAPKWALKGLGWHMYKLYSKEKNKEIVEALYNRTIKMFGRSLEGYTCEPKMLSGEQDAGLALLSPDKNVMFRVEYIPGQVKIDHNVNGRSIYVLGFIDAVRFIADKKGSSKGIVYTMNDVINNR
jgi:4-hydroxy-tetrahydrodipicolinate reductase